MSEFSDKLVSSLQEFADCQHEYLKCEKCGARANLFGWLAFSKEYHELEQRLAAAEAASWRVVVPTPTADEPTRTLEMEVIAIDHKEHVITVSAYVHEAVNGGRDEEDK